MKLNPDKILVNNIKKALKANGGFCPCSLIKDNEHKCPCKDMRENNVCHCGLFVNDDD